MAIQDQDTVKNQRWRWGILRHVEEVTNNVAKTCRYYGVSRTVYYRWLEKYQKYGEEGLLDRSRRPRGQLILKSLLRSFI
jgi:transposase-like protein